MGSCALWYPLCLILASYKFQKKNGKSHAHKAVGRDPKLGREVKTDGSRANAGVVEVAEYCSWFQQFSILNTHKTHYQ